MTDVKLTATVLQMLVRLAGLILIVLGVLFWIGSALSLIPIHMLVGLILVLALWGVAGVGARAGLPGPLVGLAVIWGLIVLILGMTQQALFPGGSHWIVQVVHLLVGLAAIGLSERLASSIKRSGTTRQPKIA
ncbi:MAG: hypothetical protein ACRDIY_12635 [Chloroflexota bacterium]